MKKLLGITLGIMTALGGFVDLGQIVFTTQAGALFGYRLLWAIVLGTVAIIVYMEMCGRVAVVAQEPVFAVVRTRLGPKLGLATLIASNLLNLLTCAAEVGGLAIGVHLLTGWPERTVLVGVSALLGVLIFVLSFQWIERLFGLSGLLMIVFAISAYTLHPNWRELVAGLSPTWHPSGRNQILLYLYFAVGIFSAMLMEYEVHFYSSGAMEEDWKPEDLSENLMVASLGSLLGSLLTVGLMVLGVILFLPHGIFPEQLSTAVFAGSFPFGQRVLTIAIVGTLACIGGAAVETALSGAYNVCQFFNWPWGKNLPARSVPIYTATWIGMLVLGTVIAFSGVRPLQLINISIIFGMAIMPLTYYPILRAAADEKLMGRHVNTKGNTAVGMFFLALIVVAAIAAFPLMLLTHSGRP
ncbi:NRAMP family divalent metal transporter [Terriglobus albidus]|uniref:NRAMP family divalent metal transporter n=1 Tax=Terriglobus albidus TaxID=1592106 RepID=UPI0021DF569B|nr:divalent metal cation transporter [Terriglobus albidus]